MSNSHFQRSAGSESEARVQARLAWNGWPDNENSRREIAAHEARDPVSAAAWDRVVSAVTKSAPSLDTSQHAGMLPERELAGGGADTDSHATQAPGDIKEFRACQLHWSEPYGSTIGRAADEIERLSGDAAQPVAWRKALERIAEQQLVEERLVEGGDYEYGYEQIVKIAREALAAQPAAPVHQEDACATVAKEYNAVHFPCSAVIGDAAFARELREFLEQIAYDFPVTENSRRHAADFAAQLGEHMRAVPQEAAVWEPTEAQVRSACLSYRHDYGLLDVAAQRLMHFHAREWLRAWQKEGAGVDRNEIIERCAVVVDQANREGPYQAIAAASRIRALKTSSSMTRPKLCGGGQ